MIRQRDIGWAIWAKVGTAWLVVALTTFALAGCSGEQIGQGSDVPDSASEVPLYVVPKADAAADGRAPTCNEAQLPITAQVMGWASAWQAGNLTAYSAAYASGFTRKSAGGYDRWVADIWNKAKSTVPVAIEAENIQVNCEGEVAVARFKLTYTSFGDTRRDILMRLMFVQQNGHWVIRSEEGETGAPAGRRNPTAGRIPG